jgi:hypothetical protein
VVFKPKATLHPVKGAPYSNNVLKVISYQSITLIYINGIFLYHFLSNNDLAYEVHLKSHSEYLNQKITFLRNKLLLSRFDEIFNSF